MDLRLVGDAEGGEVGPAFIFRPALSVDGQVQAGADGEIQGGHGAQEVSLRLGKPQQVIGIEFTVKSPAFGIAAYIEKITYRRIVCGVFKGILIQMARIAFVRQRGDKPGPVRFIRRVNVDGILLGGVDGRGHVEGGA